MTPAAAVCLLVSAERTPASVASCVLKLGASSATVPAPGDPQPRSEKWVCVLSRPAAASTMMVVLCACHTLASA